MKKSIALLLLALSPAVAAELTPKEIYQKAGPAVVLLLCVDKQGAGELGTGSFIDAQGRILTNAHVVLDASGRPFEKIRVYRKPARLTGDSKIDLADPLPARLLKWDRGLDLALLELEEKPEGIAPLAFGDSDAVEAGESVVAIGHPEQGGLWTLTQGVLSTVIADLGGVKGKDVFQTDASINRGNSGGPLIARSGELIGVNTSMARKASDGLTITSVNFAVKSNVARRWLASAGAAPAPPAAKPAAKPAAAPAPRKPTPKPAAAETPAKPAPIAAAPKILTPAKPFKAEDLLAQEMAEMEDLEKELQGEIEKRR